MKLELKEHELEQAIEVFISSFVNHPVKVNYFDLSGMRSKDGLSAMVDFTVVGVSDVREPKETSVNVKPTNTAWREKEEEDPVKEERNVLEGKDLEDWTKFLELITDNVQYKNYDAILDLIQEMSEPIQQKVFDYPLYIDMINAVEKSIDNVVDNFLNHTAEEPTENLVEETEKIEEVMEEEEELEPEPEPEEVTPVKRNIFGSNVGTKPATLNNSHTHKKLFK